MNIPFLFTLIITIFCLFFAVTSATCLNIRQCRELALKNNKLLDVAKADKEIAEAKKRQTESAYWPSLDFNSVAYSLDKDPYIVIPEQNMSLGIQGYPMVSNGINVTIPEQRVKQMDKFNWLTTVDLRYPLFTGGLITGINDKAATMIKFADNEIRKAKIQIIHDVDKLYFTIVFSKKAREIASDAVVRMQAILDLAQAALDTGLNSTVQTNNILRSRIFLFNIKSMLAEAEAGLTAAKASLLRYICLSDTNISFEDIKLDVTDVAAFEDYLKTAMESNIELNKLKLAMTFYGYELSVYESELYPSLSLIANFSHRENPYDYGVVSPANRTFLMGGLNLYYNIFQGFRSASRIEEAKATIQKISEQKQSLETGIEIKLLQEYSNLKKKKEQADYLKSAYHNASENRKLCERSYINGIMELKEFIESQLLEAFSELQYEKAVYDSAIGKLEIDLLTGGLMK